MLQPFIERPHSRSTLYRETAPSVYIDNEEINRISLFVSVSRNGLPLPSLTPEI